LPLFQDAQTGAVRTQQKKQSTLSIPESEDDSAGKTDMAVERRHALQPPFWQSAESSLLPPSIFDSSSLPMCEGCVSTPTIDATITPASQPALREVEAPTLAVPCPSLSTSFATSTFYSSSSVVSTPPIELVSTSQPTTAPFLPVNPDLGPLKDGVVVPDFNDISNPNQTALFHVLRPTTKTETILPTYTSNISFLSPAIAASKDLTDRPLVYPLSNTNKSSTFKASSQESSSRDQFTSLSAIWQVGRIDDLLMVLDGCSPLTDEAVQMWENVTSKHVNLAVAMAMSTSVALNNLDSVSVLVHFHNQSQANYSHDATTNEKIISDLGRENSDQSPLVINFDVVVSFYSPSVDHNLSNYLVLAFEYENKVLDYLDQLRSSSVFEESCRIIHLAVFFNGVKILQSASEARRVKSRLSSEFSFLGVGLYALCFLLISVLALITMGRCLRGKFTKEDLSRLNETGSSYDLKLVSLDVSSISNSILVDDGRAPWDLSNSHHVVKVRKDTFPSSPTIGFSQSDLSLDHSITDLFSLDESSIDDDDPSLRADVRSYVDYLYM
jgi:hypothetical protein